MIAKIVNTDFKVALCHTTQFDINVLLTTLLANLETVSQYFAADLHNLAILLIDSQTLFLAFSFSAVALNENSIRWNTMNWAYQRILYEKNSTETLTFLACSWRYLIWLTITVNLLLTLERTKSSACNYIHMKWYN